MGMGQPRQPGQLSEAGLGRLQEGDFNLLPEDTYSLPKKFISILEAGKG